jgi:hypothetical protein
MLIENTYLNYMVVWAIISFVFLIDFLLGLKHDRQLGLGKVSEIKDMRKFKLSALISLKDVIRYAFFMALVVLFLYLTAYENNVFTRNPGDFFSSYFFSILIVSSIFIVIISTPMLSRNTWRDITDYVLELIEKVVELIKKVVEFVFTLILFPYVLTKAILTFISETLESMKNNNIITRLFYKFTCKDRLNNGTWRLLVVVSIPFTLYLILPGVIFWIVVRLALWIGDGYSGSKNKENSEDDIARRLDALEHTERMIKLRKEYDLPEAKTKKKTSTKDFDDDPPF